MRATILVIMGLFVSIAMSAPSQAAINLGPERQQAAPSPNIIEVDRRCGPGRVWVPRHRNRHGDLVRGHCRPRRR
jgi:hypothetical protein